MVVAYVYVVIVLVARRVVAGGASAEGAARGVVLVGNVACRVGTTLVVRLGFPREAAGVDAAMLFLSFAQRVIIAAHVAALEAGLNRMLSGDVTNCPCDGHLVRHVEAGGLECALEGNWRRKAQIVLVAVLVVRLLANLDAQVAFAAATAAKRCFVVDLDLVDPLGEPGNDVGNLVACGLELGVCLGHCMET